MGAGSAAQSASFGSRVNRNAVMVRPADSEIKVDPNFDSTLFNRLQVCGRNFAQQAEPAFTHEHPRRIGNVVPSEPAPTVLHKMLAQSGQCRARRNSIADRAVESFAPSIQTLVALGSIRSSR